MLTRGLRAGGVYEGQATQRSALRTSRVESVEWLQKMLCSQQVPDGFGEDEPRLGTLNRA